MCECVFLRDKISKTVFDIVETLIIQLRQIIGNLKW